MSIFNLHHLGRWGNTLFGYAFARGYCERHGLELHMDPWVGEQIFEISHPRCSVELPRMEETEIHRGLKDVSYRNYSQSQSCADFYTVEQCRRWFTFRSEILCALRNALGIAGMSTRHPQAHLRRGDFSGYKYPLVSRSSYLNAAVKFGLDPNCVEFVSDDHPWVDHNFTGEMDFLPDFYRLVRAPVLFRANSSFSFWAAVIGKHERVFSPVIDGLQGGIEHDVQFIEGNHARLSDHSFVTEILIAP
jgi:hypothetical protein